MAHVEWAAHGSGLSQQASPGKQSRSWQTDGIIGPLYWDESGL